MGVMLKKAVYKRVRRKEMVKGPLWASSCAHCEEVFQMRSWCNDDETVLGKLTGTFDRVHPTEGNQFSVTVCSFECAHAIFTGGWKKLASYVGFKKIGAKLVQGSLKITTVVRSADELIEEWEDAPNGQRTLSVVTEAMGAEVGR